MQFSSWVCMLGSCVNGNGIKSEFVIAYSCKYLRLLLLPSFATSPYLYLSTYKHFFHYGPLVSAIKLKSRGKFSQLYVLYAYY